MSDTITVTRYALRSHTPGNRRPISTVYECYGPDGRKFTNASLATLRDVLKRRYPDGVKIVKEWEKAA